MVLTWKSGSDPAPPLELYAVYRDGVKIGEIAEPRFEEEWLLAGKTYQYTVRTIGADGESADSPPARITTPPSRAFEIGPYLQQLSATGAAVVWQTYEPATTALSFGPAGGPLQVVERDSTLTRRHVVSVGALAPGTTYEYRWESDGKLGDVSRFTTPPASPRDFSFGVIGDFGIGTPAARSNLRRLSTDSRLSFAITTGDNAQIYGTEEEYRSFVLGPLRDLIATKPFWPSVGNHDYYNLQNYKRFFALPNGGLHYSFSYGGVLFLSLDSNRFDGRQRRWLRAELRAPRRAARSRTSTIRCGRAAAASAVTPAICGAAGSCRSCSAAGVDLVLNGHVQNYERSKPLRSGRRSRKGIVYVVTGGGGARLNGFVTKRRPKWSARRGASITAFASGSTITSSKAARSTRAATRVIVSGSLVVRGRRVDAGGRKALADVGVGAPAGDLAVSHVRKPYRRLPIHLDAARSPAGVPVAGRDHAVAEIPPLLLDRLEELPVLFQVLHELPYPLVPAVLDALHRGRDRHELGVFLHERHHGVDVSAARRPEELLNDLDVAQGCGSLVSTTVPAGLSFLASDGATLPPWSCAKGEPDGDWHHSRSSCEQSVGVGFRW